MTVVVKADNTASATADMKKAIAKALEEIGEYAESYAKSICPVDTGRLRNSITHDKDEEAAYIGTNVEYAAHVELGTSRQKAQPYLKPAATKNASKYRAIIESALKNG